jgi:DNA replication protein DnaC
MEHETEPTSWTPIGAVMRDLAARLPNAGLSAPAEHAAARCPECDGAGYYKVAVPFGHSHFGMLFPCACTLAAQEQRECADLMRLSNLAAFRDQTFATFDSAVPGLKEVFTAARVFAGQPQGWLVLLGSYGVGKTHLAAAISHTVIERGDVALLAVVPDLLDYLRATFAPTSDVTYDTRFDQVRTVPLLILDDLGTEAATPWAREKLYQLINHRYQERLPTVITSNRALDELEPRLASRLVDRRLSQVIQIEAEDYRRSGGRDKLEPAVELHAQQKEIGQ